MCAPTTFPYGLRRPPQSLRLGSFGVISHRFAAIVFAIVTLSIMISAHAADQADVPKTLSFKWGISAAGTSSHSSVWLDGRTLTRTVSGWDVNKKTTATPTLEQWRQFQKKDE